MAQTATPILINPFKRGDRIVVPKGTRYTTTHPQFDGIQVSKRAATVTVFSIFVSYCDSDRDGIVEPKVSIAGTGGYWKDFRVTEDLILANGRQVEYFDANTRT